MSNKGAIKKTDLRADSKTRNQSKLRSLTQETSSERHEKPDIIRARRVQGVDYKGDGDAQSKVSQNSLTRIQASGTRIKGSTKSVERKVVKPSVNMPLTKTKTSDASAPSSRSTRSTMKLKIKSDEVKMLANHSKTKSSSELAQRGYSEKRGLSIKYIPKSDANKLRSNKPSVANIKSSPREKLALHKLPGNNSSQEGKERKQSRTLSPSEVKVLRSAGSNSSILQGQLSMQENLRVKRSVEQSNVEDHVEDDYEDDFEDYESDFQECTDSEASQVSEASNNSNDPHLDPIVLRTQEQPKIVHSAGSAKTEEEHMHDSGHYELAEARKRAARIESLTINYSTPETLTELRQSVNRGYSDDKASENKSLPSSTDEGFEDSRSGDFVKTPPLSQVSLIDFRKSKEEKNVKKVHKAVTRGQELLKMLKLDTMEWTLFECMPVPYDEFIQNYGKLNVQQMSTQTGEDNLHVEIQTEEILYKNMWTQFPVTCRKNIRSKEDIDLFRKEQKGVGSDDDTDLKTNLTTPSFDIVQLNDFLSRAGRVMLSLLEERRCGGNVFSKDSDELLFSDGFVKLSVGTVTFLVGRAVTIIQYSENVNKVLLTVHAPAEEEIETSRKQDFITDSCIGCIWNMSEPSMPTKLFYSPCPISVCCFHLTNYNILVGGLEDGSLSLWDLKEDEVWHHKIFDKVNQLEWVIRTPTYTTAGNIEDTHLSRIVAIRILSKTETKLLETNNNKCVPIQICSLDEEGFLIIWTILPNLSKTVEDIGLSQWGTVRLVKSQVIPLKLKYGLNKSSITMFVDIYVDASDNNNLFIATNSSNVLHATCIGNKTNPIMYKKSDIDSCGSAMCIERCPFKQSYFLVGCDDGTIRLHSLNTERPILQLKHEYASKVKVLQWSKSKPLTVYVLDNDSRIHIWNLNKSDLHPEHTLHIKRSSKISTMQLSPCRTEQDMGNQYLAFGSETGDVEIHKLKKEFYYSKKDDLLHEMNTFMRYVAIL